MLMLCVILTGCRSSRRHVVPLTCPVVTCKAIKCKTPPRGMPYMSDEWRCIPTT
jgi:hypothetical protein